MIESKLVKIGINVAVIAYALTATYLLASDVIQIQQTQTNTAEEAAYEHELMCGAAFDTLSAAIIAETESCITDTECHALAVKYNIPNDCL